MNFERMRQNMIDGQILPNRVTDQALIGALAELPRELFVPERLRGVAYIDEDLPLGNGRHLAEPRVFSRLLQEATVASEDLALVVGAGTGYSAAVLARLSAMVMALEEDASLAAKAEKILTTIGTENVAVVEGPLASGWPKEAPYDVILIDGTVPSVSKVLVGQLAPNGRLLAVEGDGMVTGKAVIFEKRGTLVSRRPLFDAAMPLLPGFQQEEKFAF